MITITESVQQELDGYFAESGKKPIKFIVAGGCGGPRLSMVLEEPAEDDQVFEDKGYVFSAAKELLEATGPLVVDLAEEGFAIYSTNPLPESMAADGGCGCPSSSSCASAGSGGCGGGCN